MPAGTLPPPTIDTIPGLTRAVRAGGGYLVPITRYAQPMNQNFEANAGSWADVTYRQQTPIEQACLGLVAVYGNFLTNSASPGQGDTAGPNQIYIEASFELPQGGGINPIRFFFNGLNGITLDPGAIVRSDVLPLPLTGLTYPFGYSYQTGQNGCYVRTYVQPKASPNQWPVGRFGGNQSQIDIGDCNNRDGGGAGGNDILTSGTAPFKSTSTGRYMFGPFMLLGVVSTPQPVLGIFGTSKVNGRKDRPEDTGWIRRACIAHGIPFIMLGTSGERFDGQTNETQSPTGFKRRYRSYALQFCSHGLIETVTNDFAGSITFNQAKARLFSMVNDLYAQGIYVAVPTCGVRTDAGNTAAVAGMEETWSGTFNPDSTTQAGRRGYWNAWLRDTSASGAIVQSGNKISKIVEFDYAMNYNNSGIWKPGSGNVTNTTDGIHETATGYTAEAAYVDMSWCRLR